MPNVFVNRSTDGGLTFGNPVTVASGSTSFDKNWTVCDNTSTSPFYGHCYTEFDDNAAGDRLKMATSTDGGLTWGAALNTGNSATGIGGQPVVQPALALVHQQRRHREAEQHRAQQRPVDTDPPAVVVSDAPQPEDPHAGRLREEADEDGVLGDQDHHRRPAVPDRVGEEGGEHGAERPVDEQRREPAGQAYLRAVPVRRGRGRSRGVILCRHGKPGYRRAPAISSAARPG